jgi:diguanylate cyclase (GGDEF)-like protein
VIIGFGGGSVTGLVLVYLVQRRPAGAQLVPFLLVLVTADLLLFLLAVLVARALVPASFRPLRGTIRALTQMTRDHFVHAPLPQVSDPDSSEILRQLWEFGRSMAEQERIVTEQHRGLQIELNRVQTELRAWQHREAQARGLIDLIAEMNQALGLQAVLERLAHGVSRFFAGDGVAIWVGPYQERDLQLVVQVAEHFPAKLAAKDEWVVAVLNGALQKVKFHGARMTNPSVAVSLADARGTAIGILALTPIKRAEYSSQELAFLRSVIGQAGLAVQNALAYDATDALSRMDPLTGLQNRREFDRVLQQEVDRASRYQRFVSLVMVDIDNFKAINDQRGHPAGDWALQRVSELLRGDRLRGSDAAFRIGGEEFAIVLTETDKPGALIMAERLRQATEAMKLFGDGVGVTLSLGVATFPLDGRDPQQLIAQSDRALYEAKNAGRNLVIPA